MNWFIIFFFIIAISLFLITKYYLLKKEKSIEEIEHFKNENELTPTEKLYKYHDIIINYLDAKNARKLIKKDGIYFQGMNQSNLSARHCSTIDELYNKYLDAFDNITDKEKQTVDKFILELLDNIKNSNNKLNDNYYYFYVSRWLKTISIAKAKSWLEAGMPHTLDKTIIMDANWFQNPRKKTLLHEITHVHQRLYPFEIEDLYTILGYTYYPDYIKGMEQIYNVNRNNPDGTSAKWLWTNKKDNSKWWIGAIFKTITPNNLTDVNMVALKLDNGTDGTLYYLKQNPTPLNKFKSFIDFFGENPNNYHPNEMIAKFAEWYLTDILMENSRSEYYNYEGYIKFKNYFENMIKKFY